jgi:hypothetical protein
MNDSKIKRFSYDNSFWLVFSSLVKQSTTFCKKNFLKLNNYNLNKSLMLRLNQWEYVNYFLILCNLIL